MSRTAIIAISRNGSALARRLASCMGDDATLYLEQRFHAEGETGLDFDLPVRPLVQQLFGEHQRLVLFMPVGAAVRLLAPCLQDKHADPAVVCVDDAGLFAVSLLSGHLGGADRLAREVADALGATPVITSAAHVTGTLAVDLLGHEFGWQIEAKPDAVTRASAAVVNGDPVGIFQQAGEPDWWPRDQPMPRNVTSYASLEDLQEASCAAALIISDQQTSGAVRADKRDAPVVVYRPPTLIAGMGCRRGVPLAELEELLVDTFETHNLALGSLRCIATAELKREEPGLIQLADKYGVSLLCYTAEQLNSVFGSEPLPENTSRQEALSRSQISKGEMGGFQTLSQNPLGPTPYPKVRKLLGMWGVSEPAALLAAGSENLLVPRVKTSRATIAVARMEIRGTAGPVATEMLCSRGGEV